MSQEQILNNLRAYQENLIKQANIFIKQEAELIMTDAKEQTPVDTGALRASGYVGTVVTEGDTTKITLGFGGTAAPYALKVHEDLTAYHPVEGTKAKYLEDPFNDHNKDLTARFAEALKGVTV